MQIILSPSKKLNLIKTFDGSFTHPKFIEEAEKIISLLKHETVDSIAKKMKISNEIAEDNYKRYKNWKSEISDEHIHAGFLYDGTTFEGLNIASFDYADIHYAQSHLSIISALYGVLRPLDGIMPYRLEMGQKGIVIDGKKNLYDFWKNKITSLLNFNLNDDNILINLVSDEYFKVIDKKSFKGRIITPTFLDYKNGSYKVISSYVKKARGSMARYIIKKRISEVEDLKKFDYGGYEFDSFENDIMIFKKG